MPPKNIGLAALALVVIAFAGTKGLEILSNLTKDSSSSNPISKDSSSPDSKALNLEEEINVVVQERESLKPIEGVEVEYFVEGPSVRISTDRNGQVGITIPSTRAVKIILRKKGYKAAPDTINLQVDRKKTRIFFLDPELSQPPLNQSSMLVPSIPPINSSPSPKLKQQNRIEFFKENFEGNLLPGSYISNHVTLTEGKTGKGLKISLDKSEDRGARSFRLPEVFKAGKTYQASVWCKADKGAKCQIFLGDDMNDLTPAYENKAQVDRQGNGEWQKLTTSPIKMSHDEYMSVYVYSTVPGTSATYDDILVEEVIN